MKKKKILATLFMLALCATTVLIGGLQAEAATKEERPKKGVKVVNGIEMDEEQYISFPHYEPKTLDSARSSISTSWDAMGPIFEGLTAIQGTPEGVDKIVPGMAERWEHNKAGTEYTFYLRDAQWSDGVPVTAHDFEYAIKRCIDPKTASPYAWFFFGVIKNAKEFNEGKVDADAVGIGAIDDKTLKFELEKPVPYFMQLTYFTVLFPQRKDIVEKYGEAYGSEAEQIVCNGPFVIKEWVHRGKIVYEKNPYYWDKANVYLDKVYWQMIEDENARMQALLNGDVDFSLVRLREWKDKFDSMDEFSFVSMIEPHTGYHLINCADRYFRNVKVRKAFSAAFNRDEYIEQVVDGVHFPGWQYVPNVIVIGEENYQKKIGNPQYIKKLYDEVKDPKALLIEGLKELGEDPDPANMEVRMMFRGTDQVTKERAEWYQQVFKQRLDVNLKVDLLQYNIAYDKVHKGDFQFFDTGWIGDYNDPSTFFDYWHSVDGYYNYDMIGWRNEEFDNIIKEAGRILDNNKRARLYKRAEEIFVYEDCVVAPYQQYRLARYQRSFVKDFYPKAFAKLNFKGVYTLGRGK